MGDSSDAGAPGRRGAAARQAPSAWISSNGIAQWAWPLPDGASPNLGKWPGWCSGAAGTRGGRGDARPTGRRLQQCQLRELQVPAGSASETLCAGLNDHRGGIIGAHRDGGYAEFVAVPARNLVALPESISFEEACLIPNTIAPVVKACSGRARIHPGEHVLIVGAGGGMGLHAVQAARACGGRVIAALRSTRTREAVLEAGADVVLSTNEHDLPGEVRRVTGRRWSGRGARFRSHPGNARCKLERTRPRGPARHHGLLPARQRPGDAYLDLHRGKRGHGKPLRRKAGRGRSDLSYPERADQAGRGEGLSLAGRSKGAPRIRDRRDRRTGSPGALNQREADCVAQPKRSTTTLVSAWSRCEFLTTRNCSATHFCPLEDG